MSLSPHLLVPLRVPTQQLPSLHNPSSLAELYRSNPQHHDRGYTLLAQLDHRASKRPEDSIHCNERPPALSATLGLLPGSRLQLAFDASSVPYRALPAELGRGWLFWAIGLADRALLWPMHPSWSISSTYHARALFTQPRDRSKYPLGKPTA